MKGYPIIHKISLIIEKIDKHLLILISVLLTILVLTGIVVITKQFKLSRYIRTAEVLLTEGRYIEAITEARRAVELKKTDARAYVLIARAYRLQNNHLKALFFIRKALKLKPILSETYLEHGRLYVSERKINKAIIRFRKALEINPRNYDARYELSRIYNQRGQYALALQEIKSAEQFGEHVAEFHLEKGIAYSGLDEVNSARKEYEIALEIDPDNVHIMNQLARTYIILGMIKEASQILQQSLQIKKDNSIAYRCLGSINLRLGKWTDVRHAWERADNISWNNWSTTQRHFQNVCEAVYFANEPRIRAKLNENEEILFRLFGHYRDSTSRLKWNNYYRMMIFTNEKIIAIAYESKFNYLDYLDKLADSMIDLGKTISSFEERKIGKGIKGLGQTVKSGAHISRRIINDIDATSNANNVRIATIDYSDITEVLVVSSSEGQSSKNEKKSFELRRRDNSPLIDVPNGYIFTFDPRIERTKEIINILRKELI